MFVLVFKYKILFFASMYDWGDLEKKVNRLESKLERQIVMDKIRSDERIQGVKDYIKDKMGDVVKYGMGIGAVVGAYYTLQNFADEYTLLPFIMGTTIVGNVISQYILLKEDYISSIRLPDIIMRMSLSIFFTGYMLLDTETAQRVLVEPTFVNYIGSAMFGLMFGMFGHLYDLAKKEYTNNLK